MSEVRSRRASLSSISSISDMSIVEHDLATATSSVTPSLEHQEVMQPVSETTDSPTPLKAAHEEGSNVGLQDNIDVNGCCNIKPVVHPYLGKFMRSAKFIVEDALYEVDSYYFVKYSQQLCKAIEKDPKEPLLMRNFTASGFKHVLSVLYSPAFEDPLELDKDAWSDVLYFATTYELPPVRRLAISRLLPLASPVDRVVWGHRFDIQHWLLDAYVELCTRDAHLLLEDGRRLGLEDTVLIANTREEVREGGLTSLQTRSLVWRKCCPNVTPEAGTVEEIPQIEERDVSCDPISRSRALVQRKKAVAEARRLALITAEKELAAAVDVMNREEAVPQKSLNEEYLKRQKRNTRSKSANAGSSSLKKNASVKLRKSNQEKLDLDKISQIPTPDNLAPKSQSGTVPNDYTQSLEVVGMVQPTLSVSVPPMICSTTGEIAAGITDATNVDQEKTIGFEGSSSTFATAADHAPAPTTDLNTVHGEHATSNASSPNTSLDTETQIVYPTCVDSEANKLIEEVTRAVAVAERVLEHAVTASKLPVSEQDAREALARELEANAGSSAIKKARASNARRHAQEATKRAAPFVARVEQAKAYCAEEHQRLKALKQTYGR